jgi:hypothetical protein
VTESHKGEKKLMGSALKSGYNSHFVVTTPDGFVFTPEDLDKGTKMCHGIAVRFVEFLILIRIEMVIPQESQILPAFIVELDKVCAHFLVLILILRTLSRMNLTIGFERFRPMLTN